MSAADGSLQNTPVNTSLQGSVAPSLALHGFGGSHRQRSDSYVNLPDRLKTKLLNKALQNFHRGLQL